MRRPPAVNEILVVQSVIRRHLVAAKTPRHHPSGWTGEPDFTGDPRRLSVVAPLSAYLGLGGLYRFTFTAEPASEGMALHMAWRLYRPEDDAFQPPSETSGDRLLLAKADAIGFRYFGSLDPADKPEWRSDWPLDAPPPQLLALAVDLPAGDRRVWPELVVAPPLFQTQVRWP